jgi:hypothetical protein
MIVRGLAAFAFLLASIAGAPDAFAHNGVGAAFKGHVGGYIVYAYDGDPLNRTTLEYRLVLLDARTRNPVYDVHAAIAATWPGRASALATVTTFGNVFFYDLPNPYPRDWLMHLTLTGRLGSARATYKMHGAAPTSLTTPVVVTESGSTPWVAIVAGCAGAIVIATGTALWARRRRRGPARDRNGPERPGTGSSPPDSRIPQPHRGSSAR